MLGKSRAGDAGAQSPRGSSPDSRAMLLLALSCLLAAAAAAPTVDQSQDGESNYRADIQNIVFVVALPSKMPSSWGGLFKSSKQQTEEDAQDRSDIQVMEAFVEPSKPYGVEISSEGDGRDVEVVIAGRRRMESDIQPEKDEFKLIGATEQCGPDRQRDPETLMCIPASTPTKTPEVVMSST